MAEKWIQKAVKKPGALRSALGAKAGKPIPASVETKGTFACGWKKIAQGFDAIDGNARKKDSGP